MRPTVELHQAFLWACDVCGKDNFARAVTLSPEEAEVMTRQDLLGEQDSEGAWLMAPSLVKCAYCSAEFGTEEP